MIRAYTESDRVDVVALWNLVFADDPPRNAPDRVIERWIYHLAVHPDHRRGGLGRALVAAIEERLRALGCPKINLQVRAHNRATAAFYERLGYAVEDHVSMGKEIR